MEDARGSKQLHTDAFHDIKQHRRGGEEGEIKRKQRERVGGWIPDETELESY